MPADAVLVDLDEHMMGVTVKQWLPIVRNRILAAGYRLRSIQAKPSRRHVHLIVRVHPKPKSLVERIALQLLCGSDPDREANNLRRARSLRRMPRWARQTADVLYEK